MSSSHHSTPRRNAKRGATPPPADEVPEPAPLTLRSPRPTPTPPSPPAAAKPSPEEQRKRRFDLRRAELAALGVTDHCDVERLDKLTTLQLFTVAFCDGGDVDPAAEMMRSLCDDLALLGTIYNPGTRLEFGPATACLGRVFYRLENRARVAEELHRRQREALLDVTERAAR